jgi:hypothetical protein
MRERRIPQHQQLLTEAIEREAGAHRLILAGDAEAARPLLAEAAALYRRSWEQAPERAFGRLVGMLKATLLAGGDADEAAAYVRGAIPEPDSASSWYARGIAALIAGDDETAIRAAAGMRDDSEAFSRAADAIDALARGDASAYSSAVGAIVADFSARPEHLTGVPIADTALMLGRIAAARGIEQGVGDPRSG